MTNIHNFLAVVLNFSMKQRRKKTFINKCLRSSDIGLASVYDVITTLDVFNVLQDANEMDRGLLWSRTVSWFMKIFILLFVNKGLDLGHETCEGILCFGILSFDRVCWGQKWTFKTLKRQTSGDKVHDEKSLKINLSDQISNFHVYPTWLSRSFIHLYVNSSFNNQ